MITHNLIASRFWISAALANFPSPSRSSETKRLAACWPGVCVLLVQVAACATQPACGRQGFGSWAGYSTKYPGCAVLHTSFGANAGKLTCAKPQMRPSSTTDGRVSARYSLQCSVQNSCLIMLKATNHHDIIKLKCTMRTLAHTAGLR